MGQRLQDRGRRLVWLIAGLGGLVLCAAGLLLALEAMRAAPGHDPLHINCPPGSHGKPRFAGEGQRLEKARAMRTTPDLDERSLTTGRPDR